MFPVSQIHLFMLMSVGFLLETDTLICMTIIDHKPEDPLKEIDYIEENIQQLLLLGRMNHLMIDGNVAYITSLLHEAQPEKIDCLEPAERKNLVVDYFHLVIFTIFTTSSIY